MAPILSWPFRLTSEGTVATVDQDSDQGHAEQIGVLMLTIQGEQQMVPGFGLPDPAFSGVRPGVVAAQVSQYGPEVTIDSVASTVVSQVESDVTVTFS